MKKLFAILVLVILTITTKAQINLEHTFSSDYQGIFWFISNTNGIMYYTISDTTTNQVKLYNEDYSLYKSAAISRPSGYSMTIYYPSEQLFNTNSSIEFMIHFMKYTSLNGYTTKILIYDENASIIKDFGTYNYFAIPYIITKGSLSKLLIKGGSKNSSSQFVDQVYSLPGSPANKINNLKSSNMQPPFPNPSNTFINLPYKLENGQNTTMSIYNSNGQLIEQKQIASTFDKILLNVNSYQSGIYFYEYYGITNKFIVE
jgi:hypothetical protein